MHTSTSQLVSEMIIGGEVVRDASGPSMTHHYAATGEPNGEVPLGGAPEVAAAVAAAKDATAAWEALGPVERRNRLARLAEVVESWGDRFEAVSSAETGIPRQGFKWRLKLACEWIRTYVGYADKVGGDITASADDGTLEYTRLEPYGVVGIIITWNSPLLSLCMKIPAALAAGNTVVVKPSELTPYTPALFGRACLEAGIPPGVVNIVVGGAEAGEALTVHPDVEKISFTGGIATATAMMRSGAALVKPFCFELGGKSAYIVLPDADIDLAVTLASKEMSNAGQSCKFGSRLFVHDAVYPEYREKLVAAVGGVVVGDPEDESTMMGPLVTRAAQHRVLDFVDGARGRGDGTLLLGGGRPEVPEKFHNGYFVEPTVFEEVDPASPLGQEEIFGPVFGMFRFTDEEQMLRDVNSTRFGLSNYVHTRDLRTATRLAANLKSGTVYVNDANRRNPGAPFGGFRGSGIGSEGGRAGLDEFLRKKTIGIA
ncbi:aldehyde dehydrogenase family protein [Saccharopolyspora phatthalungensis]|uniref:Aldehyde dehydrogenase (NAD+) n=1 Tax=Saccharopolyspora phatthalungensis TaxID=664693 RepID=A0A840QDR5_9PSEU|nr:aldehyde dehydrogenase family protein [Saccharopolyspora phatthalungensis]MBB5158924.1 aldehyde dehydrogenase (NAD+) [Saccharopolyspora phatthalungensis]